MTTSTAIIVLVLLLAGNAFFVASEFAVVSARRDQLEPLAFGEALSRGSRDFR